MTWADVSGRPFGVLTRAAIVGLLAATARLFGAGAAQPARATVAPAGEIRDSHGVVYRY